MHLGVRESAEFRPSGTHGPIWFWDLCDFACV